MVRTVVVSDDVCGGAAIACRRLRTALRQDNTCDISWAASKARGMASVISGGEWPTAMDTLAFRIATRFSRYEPLLRRLSDRMGNRSMYKVVRRLSPDLVHLHGLHEGLSFDLFSRLAHEYPMVWTLHDMWPLTGYCYYSYRCDKYLSGCKGECPQIGKCGAAVRSPAREWRRRDRIYRKVHGRSVIVAPSRWMARCAERRFDGVAHVEYIANGVDLTVFKRIGTRPQVRALLGLPETRPIILAGAAMLGEGRKGTANLSGLLNQVRDVSGVKPLLVALGAKDGYVLNNDAMVAVGMVNDEVLLNLYYNAADVFVLPTQADNLPNMLVEAIAAGTPCVATDVGGCGDVVIDGQTGILVQLDDVPSFVCAIDRVLASSSAEQEVWSFRCRAYAEQAFDIRRQATRYLALYEKLIASCGLPRGK